MATAYIETTIPSYYVARASDSLIQASRQKSTQQWWDGGCSGLDLVTSLETLDEAVGSAKKMTSGFKQVMEGMGSLRELQPQIAPGEGGEGDGE